MFEDYGFNFGSMLAPEAGSVGGGLPGGFGGFDPNTLLEELLRKINAPGAVDKLAGIMAPPDPNAIIPSMGDPNAPGPSGVGIHPNPPPFGQNPQAPVGDKSQPAGFGDRVRNAPQVPLGQLLGGAGGAQAFAQPPMQVPPSPASAPRQAAPAALTSRSPGFVTGPPNRLGTRVVPQSLGQLLGGTR